MSQYLIKDKFDRQNLSAIGVYGSFFLLYQDFLPKATKILGTSFHFQQEDQAQLNQQICKETNHMIGDFLLSQKNLFVPVDVSLAFTPQDFEPMNFLQYTDHNTLTGFRILNINQFLLELEATVIRAVQRIQGNCSYAEAESTVKQQFNSLPRNNIAKIKIRKPNKTAAQSKNKRENHPQKDILTTQTVSKLQTATKKKLPLQEKQSHLYQNNYRNPEQEESQRKKALQQALKESSFQILLKKLKHKASNTSNLSQRTACKKDIAYLQELHLQGYIETLALFQEGYLSSATEEADIQRKNSLISLLESEKLSLAEIQKDLSSIILYAEQECKSSRLQGIFSSDLNFLHNHLLYKYKQKSSVYQLGYDILKPQQSQQELRAILFHAYENMTLSLEQIEVTLAEGIDFFQSKNIFPQLLKLFQEELQYVRSMDHSKTTKAPANNTKPLHIPIENPEFIIYKNLNAIACNRDSHHIQIQNFDVPLKDSEDTVSLPICFCRNCKRYFIGYETLNLYEKLFGEVDIQKIDQNTLPQVQDSQPDYGTFKHSQLYSFGYNVQEGYYTERERQNLLKKLLTQGKMTRFAIIRDLERDINRFANHPYFSKAIPKWEKDLLYLSTLPLENEE